MSNSETNLDISFILNTVTDFSSSKLVDFLNEKYSSKKSGELFTTGDIQQYLRRGFLPRPYGHHPIEIVENNDIGIRAIRVFFDRTQSGKALVSKLKMYSEVSVYKTGKTKNYSIEQLASILNETYLKASKGEFVLRAHLFAIQYADVINRNNYSLKEITRASKLSENYYSELNKGLKLARFVTLK